MTGLLLAGDGNGGRNSRDLRTRRCGFGLAIIRYSSNLEDCKLVGHARGSVPGKQSVPRAEAAALLFALLHTIGCAVFVCGNHGVCKRFWGLRNKARSKDNGLLWLHISLAIESRISKGHGVLEVVWMPSHISYERAINLGYESAHWLANQCADSLAGQAAEEFAVSSAEMQSYRDRDTVSTLILSRLIDVLIFVAPDRATKESIIASEPKHTKVD